MIPARVGNFGDEGFGAEFREVVAERGNGIAIGGTAECVDDCGVDFSGGEGIASGDVCKPYERVHESELPWMVELEARNAFFPAR